MLISKIISNESLYRTTTQSPWSREIGHRRLKWLGHVARLPDKAPARLALQEALRPTRRPQGRPKTTWIQVVTKQLQNELNIPDINTAINIAQNRKLGGLVARAKSATVVRDDDDDIILIVTSRASRKQWGKVDVTCYWRPSLINVMLDSWVKHVIFEEFGGKSYLWSNISCSLYLVSSQIA